MASRNPALSAKSFESLPITLVSEMTIGGTINKTLILLFLLLITSAWVWYLFYTTQDINTVISYVWAGAIGGFIVALVTIFKVSWAPFTAPIYTLLEGLTIGGMSVLMETAFPGIVIQAIGLTFGTLFCLLLAYKTGLIKATDGFILGVVAATGAVCLIYLVDIGLLFFFDISIPFIHDTGWFGISFSVVVVIIAALNLIIDFEIIRRGVESGAPKYMEWYGAFALMVTLVWLYMEILILLSKIRR